MVVRPLSPPSSLRPDPLALDRIGELVVQNLKSLVREAQGEGFVLLLLHLYPLFQYPETSFDMIQTHLDTLGESMSHVQMYRLFGSVLIHYFDSPLQPHQQGYLLSRTMADFIIRRFGLRTFLGKFLEFYLEVVLEPDRLSHRGPGLQRHWSVLHRMKESESVLTLPPASEMVQQSLHYADETRKQSHVSDFTFSVDLSGYNSDREYSSGESEEDDSLQEASLLAQKAGTFLGDVDEEREGGGGGGGDKRYYGREGEGQPQGSLRMMLLPQLSMGGRVSPESSLMLKSHRSEGASIGVAPAPSEGTDGGEVDDGEHSVSSTMTGTLTGGIEDSILSFNGGTGSTLLSPDTTRGGSKDAALNRSLTGRGTGIGTREEEMGGGRLQGGADEKKGEEGEGEGEGEGEEEEEEEGGEEDDTGTKKATEMRRDPEQEAINQRIAEVAGDCLKWLLRRLGPLLATHHIMNPLLNRMHRCFTGILGRSSGRDRVVTKCLEYMAELYGESVLLRLYLPRVEGWVCTVYVHACTCIERSVYCMCICMCTCIMSWYIHCYTVLVSFFY